MMKNYNMVNKEIEEDPRRRKDLLCLGSTELILLKQPY
jgi:hypothetical protein